MAAIEIPLRGARDTWIEINDYSELLRRKSKCFINLEAVVSITCGGLTQYIYGDEDKTERFQICLEFDDNRVKTFIYKNEDEMRSAYACIKAKILNSNRIIN